MQYCNINTHLRIFHNFFNITHNNPLFLISAVMAFLTSIPTILDWNFVFYPYIKETAPITNSMKSMEFQFSLGFSIAVSIPPLVDLLVDYYSENTGLSNQSVNSRLILLLGLIIPDLFILWIAIPSEDPKLMVQLYYLRNICSTFAIFTFLRDFGGHVFKTKMALIIVTILYSTDFIFFYLSFSIRFKVEIVYAFHALMLVCLVTSSLLPLNWMLFLMKLNRKDITLQQYSVCGYLICFGFFGLGILVLVFVYNASLDGCTTPRILAGYNYLVALITVALSMFQSHMTRVEMLRGQKQLLETKRMFVRLVSHEMRTPLNTAFLGLQLMKKELRKSRNDNKNDNNNNNNNNDDICEILNDVQESCDVALNILNNLLSYEKLEVGLLQLEKTPFKVSELIKEAVHPFYVQAHQLGVELHLLQDPNSTSSSSIDNTTIVADKHKLCQVVRNLISNALKFTPPNTGTITITLALVTVGGEKEAANSKVINRDGSDCCRRSITSLQIQVKDNGVGIAQENQSKLFKEIIQFSPGELQNGGGSGLGLWISKSIVDLHQGNITVHSEGLGTGCTFTATIPIGEWIESIGVTSAGGRDTTSIVAGGSLRLFKKDSQSLSRIFPHRSTLTASSQRKTASEQPYVVREFQSKVNILIVDDAPLNRKMLRQVIKGRANHICEAVDGLEAVRYMERLLQKDEVLNGGSDSDTETDTESSYPINVILMDYMMPNMDGPTASAEIRKRNYQGKIIGITGNALPSDIQNFLNHGADEVLIKPVTAEELELAVFG